MISLSRPQQKSCFCVEITFSNSTVFQVLYKKHGPRLLNLILCHCPQISSASPALALLLLLEHANAPICRFSSLYSASLRATPLPPTHRTTLPSVVIQVGVLPAWDSKVYPRQWAAASIPGLGAESSSFPCTRVTILRKAPATAPGSERLPFSQWLLLGGMER